MLRKKIIQGLSWTFSSQVINAMLGLLKIVVLTRILDKSDFGLMAILMAVIGILNLVLDAGVSIGILHFQNINHRTYSSLYLLNIVVSIILYGLLYLLTPFISILYQAPVLTAFFPVMGVHILITALGRHFLVREQKQLRFKLIAQSEIASAAVSFIAAIVLAFQGYGLWSLVLAELIKGGIMYSFFFLRGMHLTPISLDFSWKEVKPVFQMGVYSLGGQLVNLVNKDLDILLIGKFFDTSVLGAYSLAKQLVSKPAQVIHPVISKVLSPILPRYQEDQDQLREKFLLLQRSIATINVFAFILLAASASILVSILYGEAYLEIVGLVQILCIYMYLRAFARPMGVLIIATGRTDLGFFWNLAILPPYAFTLFSMMPFGINAVAWGLSGLMALLTILGWIFVIRPLIKVTLKTYLWQLVPQPKSLLRNLERN
ncbi:MAG: MOP flippase family protein [Cyanothece sp. SIO1E1]|nr:MOP flippase family protein [Cyanothece sp. SIO1E1]